MSEATKLSFDEWMAIGIESGWCGPPVCYTHDFIPMSEDEFQEFYTDGNDICLHIVRMYESHEHKVEIEKAHSPSQWRNHYTERTDSELDIQRNEVDPYLLHPDKDILPDTPF